MVHHKTWSDSKCLQVSRTLHSILANLHNAVVWIISTRPLISKSSSLFINPLVIAQSAPITTGITVTFMFHSFCFSSLVSSKYLSVFLPPFSFTLLSAGTAKSTFRQLFSPFFFFFFFWLLLTISMSGRLAEIR